MVDDAPLDGSLPLACSRVGLPGIGVERGCCWSHRSLPSDVRFRGRGPHAVVERCRRREAPCLAQKVGLGEPDVPVDRDRHVDGPRRPVGSTRQSGRINALRRRRRPGSGNIPENEAHPSYQSVSSLSGLFPLSARRCPIASPRARGLHDEPLCVPVGRTDGEARFACDHFGSSSSTPTVSRPASTVTTLAALSRGRLFL